VIDGYCGRKGVDNIKYYFKSGLFNVGGHAWCITYFPQGDETTGVDWISLHLTLVHTLNAQVKVHLAFSLLDSIGEPASPHIMARDDITFTDSNYITTGIRFFV
jgi:speckle-type POZ protein